MDHDDHPSADEHYRRLAALDSEAAERDRLFNAALIVEGMGMPLPRREGAVDPRRCSAGGRFESR